MDIGPLLQGHVETSTAFRMAAVGRTFQLLEHTQGLNATQRRSIVQYVCEEGFPTPICCWPFHAELHVALLTRVASAGFEEVDFCWVVQHGAGRSADLRRFHLRSFLELIFHYFYNSSNTFSSMDLNRWFIVVKLVFEGLILFCGRSDRS